MKRIPVSDEGLPMLEGMVGREGMGWDGGMYRFFGIDGGLSSGIWE